MSRPSYNLVQWTNTGTTSGPIKLAGNQIVGFILPATIASIAFTFNMTITTDVASSISWIPVCDSSGSAISFTTTAATAKYYGFSQDQIAKFTGIDLLQMVAGSSETQNQAIYAVLIPRPSI